MASYNICGKTLHSTLQLPVKATQQRELQGSSLQRLQLTMKHKHYLIIDEMSMLGQRIFAWVDRLLKQATACLDKPLGGISVILFGDFARLPPACHYMQLRVKVLCQFMATPSTVHFLLLLFLTKSYGRLEQTLQLAHSENCSCA